MEKLLNSLEDMSLRARKEKDNFYADLKKQVENNPQLQVRQINSGGKNMLVRLSAEEAINQDQDWKDFFSEHEERYNSEFLGCLEKIKEPEFEV